MPQNRKLLALLDKLVRDGKSFVPPPPVFYEDKESDQGGSTKKVLLPSAIPTNIRNKTGLRRWYHEITLLQTLAGKLIEPWSDYIVGEYNDLASVVESRLSALETVKFAVEEGMLSSFEDLIVADTFADLMEQGKYLLSQGYFLAAGVIFRAVLEERLRKLCERNSCAPTNDRPTINDFNMALYKATPPIYSKSMMMHLTAIAVIGNDAAHNSPALKDEDVERLATGVEDFLAKYL